MTEGSPWLTSVEVAEYARRHQETILLALRRGELEGVQHKPLAAWRIHRDAVDRWLKGEKPAKSKKGKAA
jgi:excisionase family DNA binding protein